MALSGDPSIPPTNAVEEEVRRSFELDITPDTMCFFCSDPVHHPSVYWCGYNGMMWLHPYCVARLAAGLFQDLERLQDLEALKEKYHGKAGS